MMMVYVVEYTGSKPFFKGFKALVSGVVDLIIILIMNKFLRDYSFMALRNRIGKMNPGFDQNLTSSRLPRMPRIVVYSNSPVGNELIKQYV